jgi:hypothetical protein
MTVALAVQADLVNHGARIAIGSDAVFSIDGNLVNLTDAGDGEIDLDGSLRVSGNWVNEAGNTVFAPGGTGTVTLSGGDQALTGTTAFPNLTKQAATPATLTFAPGAANRTTIEGALVFTCVNGDFLTLQSSSLGTPWQIDPQGSRTIAWLAVDDSANVNALDIDATHASCRDLGGNTHWLFDYEVNFLAGAGGTVAGSTPQFVSSGEDCTGVAAVADAGFHFIGWTGGYVGTDNPLTITGVSGSMTITANFAENALSLAIAPTQISENGGVATGTISRNSGTAGDLVVDLVSDDLTAALVPPQVTIPNGSLSADFPITAVNDDIIDGDQTATITATAANHLDGVDTVDVLDDEVAGFIVTPINLTLLEGTADIFTVRLNAEPASDVVLDVSSGAPATADVDQAALTFTSLTWADAQTVTVTSTENTLHGDDSVTVTVAVDPALSDDAFDAVPNQVVPVSIIDNDPTAADDAAACLILHEAIINVLANDTDPNGDDLTILNTTLPAEGTVTITHGGTRITYAAGANPGEFQFNYTVGDAIGNTATATVTVTVAYAVALGTVFPVLSDEVSDGQGGALAAFTRKPTLYGRYYDPIKDPGQLKPKIAKHGLLTKVSAKDNPPKSSVDCEWKKKVCLYDRKAFAAAWKAGTLTAAVLATPLSPLPFAMRAKTTENGIKIDDDLLDNAVRMLAPPEIAAAENPWDATPDPVIHAAGRLRVVGMYFGIKPPKAWFEYLDAKGAVKKATCGIVKAFPYANPKGQPGKSCMDTATGDSELLLIAPKKWPTGWNHGESHDLVLDNGIGLVTVAVATKDIADNTAPVAVDDAVAVAADSAKNVLDPLDNDTDADADPLEIVIVTLPDNGGTVKVSKNTVLYTPAEGFIGDETVGYRLEDGLDGVSTEATITVTVSAP